MNLDFGLEPVFSWYVVLLCLSGVVMVALAAIKAGEQSMGSRALGAVAGVGFLGYGIYLGFIFDGGSYMMFFQAFILPVGLIVNFIRSMLAKNEAAQQQYPGVHPQQQASAPTQAPGEYAQPQPYTGGPTQPQPYPGAPAQQYPAQAYQADPTQAAPMQPGPTQPGPTQPS